MTNKRHVALTTTFCLLATVAMLATGIDQGTPASGNTWHDRAAEIEEYIRSAEVTGIDDVNRPSRGRFVPGGPVEFIAWKPIRPVRYNGYWESYKSVIAVYELDKLLALGMVPPAVEKRVKGELGAAVMWVSAVKSFKDVGGEPGQQGIPGPPAALIGAWNQQLTKAKMFDNLIANMDSSLGNWLVDPAWNLILIDHARSFTDSKDLRHKLMQVDQELWAKMKALDEATLTAALGKWLDKSAIAATLQRRDLMQQAIDTMKTAR